MPKENAQPPLLASAFFDAQPGVHAAPEVQPPTEANLTAYAMRSAPDAAPRPSHYPMGVEALLKVADGERIKSNTLATTIAQRG